MDVRDERPWGREENGDPVQQALWVAEWPDGRMTLVSIPTSDPFDLVARRLRSVEPNCDRLLEVRLSRVSSLELGVGPACSDNEPLFGRIAAEGRRIQWQGPHSAWRSTACWATEEPAWTPPPDSPTPPVSRIWSCVCSGSELIVFTAPDLEAARQWIDVSVSVVADASAEDVEPVDCVELRLVQDGRKPAPVEYRLWIDGHRVGWPRLSPLACGAANPPPSPLHAEARVSLPLATPSAGRGRARVDRET